MLALPRRWPVLIAAAAGVGLAVLLAWRAASAPGGRPVGSIAAAPARGRATTHDPRTRRGSIEGHVRDPSATAIAGATVCAYARSDELASDEARDPACATSGPDGTYRLANLFAVEVRLEGQARGFLPASWHDERGRAQLRLAAGEQRRGVDLTLAPGGVEVHGRVRDLSGGVVAGAQVWLSPRRGFATRGAAAVTRSDEQGTFTAWVAPGELTARAQAFGYTPGETEGVAPGQVLELLLTPESVLVGRVVGAGTQNGVAGALVSLDDIRARSDAEGRFRIEQLPPGRYAPIATTEDGFGRAPVSVLLGLGETSSEIVIELHHAVPVTGRVVDADTGEGCDRGRVELRDAVRDRSYEATLGPDGGVRLRGVLSGSYRVTVACADSLGRDDFPAVEVRDVPLDGLLWEVRRGLAIRGRVADAAGGAVASAAVSASGKGNDPRAPQSTAATESRPDGSFELLGLRPDHYALRVESEDHPIEEIADLALGTTDLEGVRVVLEASGAVEGTVVDEHGAPVGGVFVRARGKRWGAFYRDLARSRDDGGFTLGGLAPGEVLVFASRTAEPAPIRAPGTTDDDVQETRVVVEAGETAHARLVVESQRGSLRGRVLDEHGRPVSDAFVDAERESESAAAAPEEARRALRWGFPRRPSLTELDGRFALGGLGPGRYTIHAYREGGGEAVVEHVPVGATVTLTIAPTATIAGLALAGGSPPEEVIVTVLAPEDDFSRQERFFRTGGRFQVSDLPAGAYRVSAAAPEGSAEVAVTVKAGERKRDLQLTLEGRVRVRGTVVTLEDGRPIPGIKVSVNREHGYDSFVERPGDDAARRFVTDDAGRFELAGAPAGPVSLVLYPVDLVKGEYGLTVVPASLAGGKANDLPPIRLARQRLGRRENPGDLGYAVGEGLAVTVAVVRPGGPAASAGLKVGDVITAVDGHDVTGPNAYLYEPLTLVPPGTSLALGLARGETVTLVSGKPR